MDSSARNPPPRLALRLLFWAGLPLATGVAAYWWPVSVPTQAASAPATSTRPATTPLRSDALAVFSEAQATLESTRAAELAARFPAPPPADSLDSLALKDLITRLEATKIEDDDVSGYLWKQEEPLVRALISRDGAAAADWIDAHFPKLRFFALKLLAEKDPDAAFDHLAASRLNDPCMEETLFKLLSSKAATGGPEGLLAAVQRVPWYLCRPEDYYGSNTYLLSGPDIDTFRLWLSSGSALYLVQQGIRLRGVFAPLVRTDPQFAVAAWAQWAETVPRSSDVALVEMLSSDYYRSFGESRSGPLLREAFAASSPETLAKLAAALDRLSLDPNFSNLPNEQIYKELHAVANGQPIPPEEPPPSRPETPLIVPDEEDSGDGKPIIIPGEPEK